MTTATPTLRPAPTQPDLSDSDRTAHDKSTLVRSPRTVLYRIPAGNPRGQFPADEFARDRQREGIPAVVVMSMRDDSFLVIVPSEAA